MDNKKEEKISIVTDFSKFDKSINYSPDIKAEYLLNGLNSFKIPLNEFINNNDNMFSLSSPISKILSFIDEETTDIILEKINYSSHNLVIKNTKLYSFLLLPISEHPDFGIRSYKDFSSSEFFYLKYLEKLNKKNIYIDQSVYNSKEFKLLLKEINKNVFINIKQKDNKKYNIADFAIESLNLDYNYFLFERYNIKPESIEVTNKDIIKFLLNGITIDNSFYISKKNSNDLNYIYNRYQSLFNHYKETYNLDIDLIIDLLSEDNINNEVILYDKFYDILKTIIDCFILSKDSPKKNIELNKFIELNDLNKKWEMVFSRVRVNSIEELKDLKILLELNEKILNHYEISTDNLLKNTFPILENKILKKELNKNKVNVIKKRL